MEWTDSETSLGLLGIRILMKNIGRAERGTILSSQLIDELNIYDYSYRLLENDVFQYKTDHIGNGVIYYIFQNLPTSYKTC